MTVTDIPLILFTAAYATSSLQVCSSQLPLHTTSERKNIEGIRWPLFQGLVAVNRYLPLRTSDTPLSLALGSDMGHGKRRPK
ncbi:uncharacterized protein B0H64DRAFT_123603 [Chaetomium fimeti]|uniref:Secreted protein n=1 Tax=Chaetomium fimeti TaxID=1854472 RepID=A0AAE0HIU8_9PEZI|nr:hypothetical protein B0H64DRAFT_123603 [Chaetomium fimeti]